MNIKLILYLFFIPFTMWVVVSLNIEKYFKKNSETQIKFFYFFVSLGISYLIVNFIIDLYEVFSIL